MDLSHPKGEGVNDGIEPELCTLRYTSVDEAVQRILGKGPGALLEKFNVEIAYRVVPVHPADRWLLGMRWREKLYMYIDTALPFGLRSVPKLFNAIADALEWPWILKGRGPTSSTTSMISSCLGPQKPPSVAIHYSELWRHEKGWGCRLQPTKQRAQ